MAPLPKPPGQRARRNKDTVPWQVIELQEMSQPELPAGRPWCQETREWWALWGGSAQGKYFGPTDWAALLDTARIHHAYWTSEGRAMLDHAAELRLELARFGAAPADRLRLRIQFATAEETEARAAKAQKGQSARDRREPLKALAELPADDTEAG